MPSKSSAVLVSTTSKAPWKKTVLKATAPSRAKAGLSLSGTRHQNIEGFGGCFNEMGADALSVLPAATITKVMSDLFNPAAGCRFNIARLPIGASDFATSWYSLNETSGDFAMRRFNIDRDRGCLIPYIQRALNFRPDLKLFASPWSPPTWMKNPAVYNYGRLIRTRQNLTAYARYFVKFVQAYAREGIKIEQVHPQNEVCADQKFPSCLWSGEELRSFIADYMGPAFKAAGLDTEIWLGTLNTADFNQYILPVLSDAKASKYIAGVGLQWDGKGMVQRCAESFPGVRLMQTENECGEGLNSWTYAMYVFDLMRHYLDNGVNAYVYWNMVLPAGVRSTWGWAQNSMISVDTQKKKVIYNPEFYVMKHLSSFVKAGATRVGLQGPWTGAAVAFENKNGSVVLAVHNPMDRAEVLDFQTPTKRVQATLPADSVSTLVI